jgi:hypothetical protein
MNQKNIDYLEKGLYYTGFGIEVNKALNEHIAKATPAFSIPLEMTVAGKETSFRLDFKQSEKEPSMYFFNGYQATLKSDPEKAQFFSINKNHGITTREAVNLLEGRAVAKSTKGEDGKLYEIWTQIDYFSAKKDNGNYNRNVYFPAHGFDAAKALNDLPLKKNEGKELPQWILSSIKKGNAVTVDMIIEGEERKASMVANPQIRTIDVFDDKGKRIMQGNGNTIEKQEKVKETTAQKVPVQDAPKKETANKASHERVFRKPKPVHKEMKSATKGVKH